MEREEKERDREIEKRKRKHREREIEQTVKNAPIRGVVAILRNQSTQNECLKG